MSRSRNILALLAATLGLLTLVSGCYTTTIQSGRPAGAPPIAYDERWHHGVLWGIAEISGPYDLSKACPLGWAEIKTETSFLNGLLDLFTSSIYAPQSVTVRCSSATTPEVASAEPAAPTVGEVPLPPAAPEPDPAPEPAAPPETAPADPTL